MKTDPESSVRQTIRSDTPNIRYGCFEYTLSRAETVLTNISGNKLIAHEIFAIDLLYMKYNC